MRKVLVLVALALISLAPVAQLAPDVAATAFGIPAGTAEARAYLVAAATRDLALGVWLLALLALRANRRVLAASVLAIAIVAAGDAANVVAYSGWRGASALVLHMGGLGVLLAVGWWLWQTRDGAAE
jgi:hypothetical protein